MLCEKPEDRGHYIPKTQSFKRPSHQKSTESGFQVF